jgi:hypothetical protein
MPNDPDFCDHLLYLAEIEYEGSYPVYESEFHSNDQRVIGGDQTFFNFCPLCGDRLEVIDKEFKSGN